MQYDYESIVIIVSNFCQVYKHLITYIENIYMVAVIYEKVRDVY